MSKSFSADPDGMAAVGKGFADVKAYVAGIVEGGHDRLTMLLEACGEGDDGEEMKKNLHSPTVKIEGAFTTVVEVIGNQVTVVNGMKDVLNAMEHNNTSLVNHNLRR
ncbi:hypothetical protein LFM09_21785 [Lentzea alba]|uniref:hypothetical protein n=1 Tax=Lentzea alba TaxID=2714351 RepID=UPI0039BFCC34